MQGCVVSNYKCKLLYESCPDIRQQTTIIKSLRMKCALKSLRAHFYVIFFTKNDLSIISTTFNAVERSLMHEDYQA